MARKLNWEKDRANRREYVPFYDVPRMPPPKLRYPKRARTGPVNHPKGTGAKFAVIRSHNWAPGAQTPGRTETICLACGARAVCVAKEGRGLVKVSGPPSSVCQPRTTAARLGRELERPTASTHCQKCGAWMNRKFGTCSNRACHA
jgi:hypothetical protein